jgi:uncharacterized protein YrrD
MLEKANSLKGYKLHCRDGEIGKVDEFFFDDNHWTVRYLVADTGSWLKGRQVLISPHALTSVHQEGKYITTDLTKRQIEESPSLDSDKPVSRQFEESYYSYYRWPIYWGGAFAWGPYAHIAHDREEPERTASNHETWDPHLRSTRDVDGHHIQAKDGEVGHVEDFIIDDDTWAIRYLVVDTRNWLPGKRILISPRWIERVSWDQKMVYVSLTRESIKQSPEFTAQTLLIRDYEIGLHRHYDRKGYWLDELEARNGPSLGPGVRPGIPAELKVKGIKTC